MSHEKPILFSGEMVRAILDNRKTQTRRVLKPQPPDGFVPIQLPSGVLAWERASAKHLYIDRAGKPFDLKYGVGDRLWVRETWAMVENDKGAEVIQYRANISEDDWLLYGPWRPSIHMPRCASRITLEITRVQIERLHRIGEDSAKAEGVEPKYAVSYERVESYKSYCAGFIALWDSINAKRGYSWESNPWVWVIEFKRTTSQ